MEQIFFKMNKIRTNKKNILLAVLFISIIHVQCAPKEYTISDYEKMSIFEYLKLPDEQLSFRIAALILSKDFNPNIKFINYLNKIERIADRVRLLVGNRTEPRYKIIMMNRVIFEEFKLEYDEEEYTKGNNIQNHILAGVLDRHKGACFGMPLLYISIAEELGYPIYMVSAPQHAFCRWVINDKPGKNNYINIETTAEGKEVLDVSQIEDKAIPLKAYKNGVYLKTLTKRETIGLMLHTNAGYYMENEFYDKALPYLEESVKQNKRSSASYAVLGMCYQQLAIKKLKMEERDKKAIDDYHAKYIKCKEEIKRLGIAPLLPPDYWKRQLEKEKNYNTSKRDNIVMKEENGLIQYVDKEYLDEIKRLELKYNEYFN